MSIEDLIKLLIEKAMKEYCPDVVVVPMLEKVDMCLGFVDTKRELQVICGGESGSKHRPFEWDWARDLLRQCRHANAAFWMKQGGGYPSKREKLEDLPEDLRIREFPQ